MAVEATDGVKVFYNKDYSKGRKKSVGNITVTEKRLISTVESKCGASKTEIDIDAIQGIKVRFKPSSVILFIVGLLLSVADTFGAIYIKSFFGKSYSDAKYTVFIPFIVYGIVALFCLIKGLFLIRNGFYVGFYANLDKTDFVSVSASMGKIKPLHLKTKKETALIIQSELSAAVIGAKYSK